MSPTLRKELHRNVAAYLFLTPWLIGLLLLTLGPIGGSLYLSFTNYNLFEIPQWIGWDNYVQMFAGDRKFLTSLRVTLIFVCVSVPFKLAFALLVALLLNRDRRGAGLYRTIYYIPSLLGTSVAVSLLWRVVFGGDGIFNGMLSLFGIEGADWIANPKYSLYSIISLPIWQFGSSMVIFIAGLKQIPQDLYEAASVDGGSRLQQFCKITFPMLSPVIFFNLVMQTIMSFQSFTQAFIISNGSGGPINSTLLYTLYLYQNGFNFFKMGYASAMAWVLLGMISIFTLLLFMSSSRWIHYEDGGR